MFPKKRIAAFLLAGVVCASVLPGAKIEQKKITEEEQRKIDEAQREMEEAMRQYGGLLNQPDLLIEPEMEAEPPPAETTPEAAPATEPLPETAESAPSPPPEPPPAPAFKKPPPRPPPSPPEPEGFPWPVLLAALAVLLAAALLRRGKPGKKD